MTLTYSMLYSALSSGAVSSPAAVCAGALPIQTVSTPWPTADTFFCVDVYVWQGIC